jgi:hypothetical protein
VANRSEANLGNFGLNILDVSFLLMLSCLVVAPAVGWPM